MIWTKQCAVVIPCLNEAATIGPLITQIRLLLPIVIVVDDGSTDATAEAATTAGADVIQHGANRGKGTALASGFRRAREGGFRRALMLDGDGQHSPADIPVFLRAADETDAALIVGNRMANSQAMPWLRRAVNRWMSRRLSRRAGRSLPDSQCGFRLIELEAWSRLRLETAHFEIESEMLLAFVAAGLDVKFVPVQVIYKSEQSKIHPVFDSWRWFHWWWESGKKSRSKQRASKAASLARLQQDASAHIK